jgi:DNA processing protein
MPLGLVVVEGARYSGSLITARLAIEFAREVFAVPGNVTQPVSFAPNLLIKQGAKLVTNGEDGIEELPAAIRAVLVKAQQKEAEQLNLLAANRSIPARERSLSCSAWTNTATLITSWSNPACTLQRIWLRSSTWR